jgi:hypothetical protein
MRTISDKKGNAAFSLRQSYQELMILTEPTTLHERVLKLMFDQHNHGLSTKNLSKFIYEINKIKGDLLQMQMLISNFILKADGDGVLRDLSRRS